MISGLVKRFILGYLTGIAWGGSVWAGGDFLVFTGVSILAEWMVRQGLSFSCNDKTERAGFKSIFFMKF